MMEKNIYVQLGIIEMKIDYLDAAYEWVMTSAGFDQLNKEITELKNLHSKLMATLPEGDYYGTIKKAIEDYVWEGENIED